MNNALWQAAVNANTTGFPLTEKNVVAVKNAEGKQTKSFTASSKKVIAVPKRYSFDDNGGGYNGL